MSKFTEAEREVIATYHKSIKPKKKQELYFLSLIIINKASKRPEEDAKKHRDYKYSYKVIYFVNIKSDYAMNVSIFNYVCTVIYYVSCLFARIKIFLSCQNKNISMKMQ